MFLNLKKKKEEKGGGGEEKRFLDHVLAFLARGAGRVPACPLPDSRLLSTPVHGSGAQEKGGRARRPSPRPRGAQDTAARSLGPPV